jgi:phosphotransferase system HPr (HPr) family protein
VSGPGKQSIVVLPDALHARPANLLVRLASSFDAEVTVVRKGCKANAASILEVLALGAAKGDSVELAATGADAERALSALHELIDRGFDGDLVPERGEGGAFGIAVGRALLLEEEEADEERADASKEGEIARLDRALQQVEADLRALVASLSSDEAELFTPSIAILSDLEGPVRGAIEGGAPAEAAVRRHTEVAATDLILDIRARLLAALAGGDVFARVFADAEGEERVLVTGNLMPSLVALAPKSITGIVASRPEGQTGRAAQATSHAAILARGRGLPLAIVPEHVTQGIVDDEWIAVDATGDEARVWVAPSEELLADVRKRRDALEEEKRAKSEAAKDRLVHLGVAVRVNIGALSETIPAGAEGVGLVRTELLFAARREAPDEADLIHALATIARAAGDAPVVVRLYDAGGDKPLDWLAPPVDDPEARGIALLLRHAGILKTLLTATSRASRGKDLRLLIPLTRDEGDVLAVRALTPEGLRVGAMIETADAVDKADTIARASDFVCVGTNDLSASLGGDEPLVGPRVLAHVERIVLASKAHARSVTVCGEMAGDARGARVLVGVGVDALSVSPSKLASVKEALRSVTREACEREAKALLATSQERRQLV